MTKEKVFLRSVKDPNLRYEVVSFDTKRNAALLAGKYGQFEIVPFTKEKIIADGYTLVREGEQHVSA